MKGLQYTGPDDPGLPRNVRGAPVEARRAFVEAFNEQWRVVANCDACGEGLIVGEQPAHALQHVPARARTVARMLYELAERHDEQAARESIEGFERAWASR